ncbi:hypothetical protein BDY21DRAFT_375429 [Lineolata rhizophorae]|uniref:C2H2-type domain-containing protein n=1 Tax=Lineolata rhizophorae TaxID=578093 RepID=A0A6A6NN01_9PEZI|nr:hypothetical protein BDY21DRAFT_375429 [Lineolata rhizophorae]
MAQGHSQEQGQTPTAPVAPPATPPTAPQAENVPGSQRASGNTTHRKGEGKGKEPVYSVAENSTGSVASDDADETLQCPDCSRPFPSVSRLNRHKRCVHDKVNDYCCPVPNCPRHKRGWGRKDQWVTHIKKHHPALLEGAEDPDQGYSVEEEEEEPPRKLTRKRKSQSAVDVAETEADREEPEVKTSSGAKSKLRAERKALEHERRLRMKAEEENEILRRKLRNREEMFLEMVAERDRELDQLKMHTERKGKTDTNK